MKLLATAIGLVSVLALAQYPPDAKETQLLKNSRVTVTRLQILPNAKVSGTGEHDRLIVAITGGPKSGGIWFEEAGHPDFQGGAPMQTVHVDFAEPQGKVTRNPQPPTRYCNPSSKTACVSEKYALCTVKMCAEEVTMGPDAVTTKHSHDTDHMLIAISDYSLADDTVGKGVIMRNVKTGGVEYIPAGITHQLTNKTGKDIRFVVVVFR